ncbi:MAG: hypothetical protein SGILL_005668, partial [Bacillariaceae sp.]
SSQRLYDVRRQANAFYRFVFKDDTYTDADYYLYKQSSMGGFYPAAQVLQYHVHTSMHRVVMNDGSDDVSSCPPNRSNASSVDIAACASWRHHTELVHPITREPLSPESSNNMFPDYHVYRILDGNGSPLEPFYTAFVEYMEQVVRLRENENIVGNDNDDATFFLGTPDPLLTQMIDEQGIVEPNAPGVYDPFLQDSLIPDTVAMEDPTLCEQMEYYLQNPSDPNAEGALTEYYSKYDDDGSYADFAGYTANARKFFLTRSRLCGGKNFVALGRVVLGDYDDAAGFLMKEQQMRGNFLGRARFLPSRITPYFLPALSDPGTDTEAGTTGVHEILREFFLNDIVLPAQDRVRSDPETRDALAGYVTELVQGVASIGGPQTNATVAAGLTGKFVVQYLLKALLDMDPDPETVALMNELFLQGKFLYFWMEPTASTVGYEEGAVIASMVNKLAKAIEGSPALADYIPSDASYNLSKNEYAQFLLYGLGIAGNLGLTKFVFNAFTIVPQVARAINPLDHIEVGKAIMEAARANPPVKNVNIILSEDTVLNVGGSEKVFPAGTPVMASIILGQLDESKFEDAFTVNPFRENLFTDLLTFAYPGFDPDVPEEVPRRSCPAQHLAYKAGADVLSAWLQLQSNGTAWSPGSPSSGEGPDSAACMAKFSAMQFQLHSFHNYGKYFRDSSELIFPAAGVYKGAEDIEEYMRFAR